MNTLVILAIVALVAGLLYHAARRARAEGSTHRRKDDGSPKWLFGTHGQLAQPIGADDVNRGDIARRLKQLATSTPPRRDLLNYGAMCYDMAVPRGTVDFVCAECGTKTLYDNGFQMEYLDQCRRLVQAIRQSCPGLIIRLDERFLCGYCNAAGDGAAKSKGREPPTIPTRPETETMAFPHRLPKLNDDGEPLPEPQVKRDTSWYRVHEHSLDGLYLVIRYENSLEPRRVRVDKFALQVLLAFALGSDRIMCDREEERALKDYLDDLVAILGVEP